MITAEDFERHMERLKGLTLADGLGALFDAIKGGPYTDILQTKTEITSFIRDLQEIDAQQIVDVGTNRCGTAYLFSRVCRLVVSVDEYTPECLGSHLPKLALPGSEIVYIGGDSREPTTAQRVRAALDGGLCDAMFLDTLHTRKQVESEMKSFLPLVRPGGLVGIHACGVIDTNPSSVYSLWRELQKQYETWLHRDGFPGIGVLRVPGEAT